MVKKAFILFFFCITLARATQENKFVILITSYNNAEWCVKNLEMIFCQTNPGDTDLYQNYRVIIIDDASDDGNAEYIEHYIYAHNMQDKVILIKNKTRMRALANIYRALQMCQPDEIVFNHDGDDWLSDNRVFALINEIYQDPDVWITYGSFINWPTNQMGYCQPTSDEIVQKKLFRKKWWMPGQLRTFKAWLFHQVRLKDLFFEGPYFQGQFFPANSDLAIYYPMMEMAGTHFRFIPEVIYIRNVATPINDFKANKDVQVLGSKLIREKEIYPELKKAQPDYFKQFENQKADLLFFSQSIPHAKKLIESCTRLVRNLGTVYILYPANQQEYTTIISPSLSLVLIPVTPATFKNNVHEILAQSGTYMMFAHDGIVIQRYVDCAQCILALEKAFAYGFFLGLDQNAIMSRHTGMGQPIPALNQIMDSVYAWGFHYAPSGDWQCYNNFELTLYRKRNVLEQIQKIEFSNYHELFEQWKQAPINLEQIGLCYEQAKISYINSLN